MKEQLRTEFLDRQQMVESDLEAYYYSDTSLDQVERHRHDCYELLFFLEGDVITTVNEQSFVMEPGDIVIIPPETPHRTRIQSSRHPYRRFTLWIAKDYLDSLTSREPAFAYFLELLDKGKYHFRLERAVSFSIQSKITSLIECIHSPAFGRKVQRLIEMADILLSVNRALYTADHPEPARESDDLFKNILTYINLHIEDEIALEKLASLFYVSKYHISHLFKSRMGLSLYQYVIKKRLSLTRHAISAGEDITRACEQAGFNNYSSFYRAFVKEYGISPKEYKKGHQLHPENRTKRA